MVKGIQGIGNFDIKEEIKDDLSFFQKITYQKIHNGIQNKNKSFSDNLCKFLDNYKNETMYDEYENCNYKENIMYETIIEHKKLYVKSGRVCV